MTRISVRINVVSKNPTVTAVFSVSIGIVRFNNCVSVNFSLRHIRRVIINV